MRGGAISETEFSVLHKIFCKYLKLYEMDTSNDLKKQEVSSKEKNINNEVLSLYKQITGKDINIKDKFGNEDANFLNLDSFIFHDSLIYRINDLNPGPIEETANTKFYTTYIEPFLKICSTKFLKCNETTYYTKILQLTTNEKANFKKIPQAREKLVILLLSLKLIIIYNKIKLLNSLKIILQDCAKLLYNCYADTFSKVKKTSSPTLINPTIKTKYLKDYSSSTGYQGAEKFIKKLKEKAEKSKNEEESKLNELESDIKGGGVYDEIKINVENDIIMYNTLLNLNLVSLEDFKSALEKDWTWTEFIVDASYMIIAMALGLTAAAAATFFAPFILPIVGTATLAASSGVSIGTTGTLNLLRKRTVDKIMRKIKESDKNDDRQKRVKSILTGIKDKSQNLSQYQPCKTLTQSENVKQQYIKCQALLDSYKEKLTSNYDYYLALYNVYFDVYLELYPKNDEYCNFDEVNESDESNLQTMSAGKKLRNSKKYRKTKKNRKSRKSKKYRKTRKSNKK